MFLFLYPESHPDDKYINRCILHSHPVKFFVKKNAHPISCIRLWWLFNTTRIYIVVRWLQDKNGKEAREETEGKSDRVSEEGKRWKENTREGKTGIVLELSLEVEVIISRGTRSFFLIAINICKFIWNILWFFFLNTSKVQWFCKFLGLHQKNLIL